ncbi:MAG: glycosyltransferase, partial [Pseudobutyrivibrio sp.]|nr:glycosyltransferase [Pseudobutyrivibrio sp.]
MAENKRKTLLYIALTDLKDITSGVSRKVANQAKAFNNNGYDVDIIAYAGGGIGLYQRNDLTAAKEVQAARGLRQNTVYKYAKTLSGKNYDVVYLRYSYMTPAMMSCLSEHHAKGAKVVIEFPTFPITWHKPTSVRVMVSQWYYKFFEKVYKGGISQVVDEALTIGDRVETAYGIPAKNIPNGAEVSKIPLRVPSEDTAELNILCSASYYLYQGIDRLIEGIAAYEKSKSESEITVKVHIMGEGPELESYKKLVKDNQLEELVTFYGQLSGEAYDEVFDACQMAAGATAVHRVDGGAGSALKIKDYLARGIPFFYGYEEIGLPEDFPYGLRIESKEGPINIYRLIEFYNTYKDEQEEVVPLMRHFVEEHFSWEKILE